MDINFILSQTDTRPMYLQIMEQVSQRVALGEWPAGTKMPSIRELAIALKVSVITVKRAYLELEREGVIVTRQGRGSWINEDLDVKDLRRQELEQYLEKAAGLAKLMSLDEQQLIASLKRYFQSELNR